MLQNFLEKKSHKKKRKTDRITGLNRRTRKETVNWNQMTALRFQTGRRHHTSLASLRGFSIDSMNNGLHANSNWPSYSLKKAPSTQNYFISDQPVMDWIHTYIYIYPFNSTDKPHLHVWTLDKSVEVHIEHSPRLSTLLGDKTAQFACSQTKLT